jgi:hypothetical protein
MGFDVNKIIMESIQDVIDGGNKTPITEEVTKPKEVDEIKVVETKEVVEPKETKEVTENVGEEVEQNHNNVAVASAIAAGLGALTLRKKLASLNENK